MKKILQFKAKHPFLFIMAIGMLVRLLAVFFSKGFGMHDDHFLVVEQAQSWVDGEDYLKWLPNTIGNDGPQGHSFFYVGFQYLFFHMLQFFRIFDPQWKMLFTRFFHAGISLFVISFGYRIASLITERKTAYRVALLLAVFWFMPFLSVRTMVELTSIPFLMYGTLIILRQEQIRKEQLPGFHKSSFFVAGFLLAMAFSIRYQTIVYTAGLGLALLIAQNWKGLLSTILGFIASVLLFQGFVDWYIWGKPFAEFIAYSTYNMQHAYDYFTAPWYNYILVLLLLLIPPISIMLFWGFFRNWKKNFLLFLPVFLFLLFHSIFPNKQERFILPIVPMFIVLGMAGWDEFIAERNLEGRYQILRKSAWGFFWALNTVLLVFVTPMYSKKSRVEAMSHLKKYPDIEYFIVDEYGRRGLHYPPVFYTGQWPQYDAVYRDKTYKDLADLRDWSMLENQPSFVCFQTPQDLEMRLDSMMQIFPNLVFDKKLEPSFMDKLIHRINPINANEEIFIYRNTVKQPEKH